MTSNKLRAYLFIILVVVIWGFAATVIKFTLEGIPPLIFLFYRFLISSVIALPFVVKGRKQIFKSTTVVASTFIYSILAITIGLGFLFVGLKNTTVLDLSVITIIGPVLVALAAALILKEHISHKQKIGTAIAVIGASVIVFGPILNGSVNELKFSGNLLLLVYIIADSAAIILLKVMLRDKVNGILLSHTSFIIGFITITPFVFLNYSVNEVVGIVRNLALPYHLGVFYMAIFSGTIAYGLRAVAQKTLKVSTLAIFGYLLSAISASFAILFLHEEISAGFLIGAAIVVLGIVIAESKRV